MEWKGFVAFLSGNLGGGDFLSPDAEITIPENGITLKHADGTEIDVTLELETVTDGRGRILYVTLPQTEENLAWMARNGLP